MHLGVKVSLCPASEHFVTFWTSCFKRSLQRRQWLEHGSQGPETSGKDTVGKSGNETEAVNPRIE